MLNNPMYLNMILDSPQLKPLLDSNPQLRSMFSNPQALQALLNPDSIQQAMNMMNSGGVGGGNNPFNPLSSTNNSSSVTNPNSDVTGTSTNPFMNPLLFPGANSNVSNDNVDPKIKYKEQNEKLKDMGFINDDLNFEVLAKTNGNVDAAVERLLNMFN